MRSCPFLLLYAPLNDRLLGAAVVKWINPQGGTLIFSYIPRLRPFFGVQNFEFQYFFGFSEKLIFLGV